MLLWNQKCRNLVWRRLNSGVTEEQQSSRRGQHKSGVTQTCWPRPSGKLTQNHLNYMRARKTRKRVGTPLLFAQFPKKGHPKKVENYRGISLLDTAYKVLSIAVLHRLEKYSTEIIGEYQCGFMKGKSTTDHIFTLRQVMEKYYEYDKDLHMIFIDFQQAYDSIIRDRLWLS